MDCGWVRVRVDRVRVRARISVRVRVSCRAVWGRQRPVDRYADALLVTQQRGGPICIKARRENLQCITPRRVGLHVSSSSSTFLDSFLHLDLLHGRAPVPQVPCSPPDAACCVDARRRRRSSAPRRTSSARAATLSATVLPNGQTATVLDASSDANKF